MNKRIDLLLAFAFFFASAFSFAQKSAEPNQKLTLQAEQEFASGNYADAARDFREVAKHEPSNIVAVMYWGHSLYEQQKYAEAVVPYERARALEKSGTKISDQDRRILTDQLAIAYGISGQLKQAHAVLDEAIQQDPEYPMNYYNLACAYAEEGDKSAALANLSSAFERKDHMLKGEKIPDPRKDSSFQKYFKDPDFTQLMNKLEGPG
jgi:tetratricopeptide (TPR) repeat protein